MWCFVFLFIIISHEAITVSAQCGGYGGGGGGGNNDLTGVLVGFLISQAAAGGRRRARQRALARGDGAALEDLEPPVPKGKSSILTEKGEYPEWCTWCKDGGPPETEFGMENTKEAKRVKDEEERRRKDEEKKRLTDLPPRLLKPENSPEISSNVDSDVIKSLESTVQAAPKRKMTWVERIKEKRRRQKERREEKLRQSQKPE